MGSNIRGGRREGAGRKKGLGNVKAKLSIEDIKKARTEGEMPHEFLLRVSRGGVVDDVTIPMDVRIDAAKAAAPYFAPRLQAIEQKIDATISGVVSAEPLTEEEWIGRYSPGYLEAPAGASESSD